MVGLAVLVAASLVTSDVTSIAVAALVAGALVVGVLVRFALGPWRWAARATTQVLAAGLVWPAVFWAVTLRAPDVTPPARPVPGQHIWQLSTSSRIAYAHFGPTAHAAAPRSSSCTAVLPSPSCATFSPSSAAWPRPVGSS